MSYIAYSQINSLDETFMIAGTDYTLTFNVFEEDGVTPQDIGGATVRWMLAPYGQSDFNVLQINGVITGTSTFTVSISANDTEEFSGKYIQQLRIDSFFGQIYRPAQGVVLFIPRTPLD